MEPDTFAALAYDQGYVLKAAMDRAAARGGITRERVRDAMAATHYKGITGTVTFDDKGDWVRPYLYITVKDGRFGCSPAGHLTPRSIR
jgi:branched-chain amino acid transport system substrate-binding protein